MSYLDKNKTYWEQGYNAVNVDHPIFRFHGRILRPLGIGGNNESLLDFGCGQGAAVNFFAMYGFHARGVDISETDIGIAKIRYPQIAQNFAVCDPDPKRNDYYGFPQDIAVITAIQCLYFFSDEDFKNCIEMLYNSMGPGGIFFATMMGEQSREYYDNSSDFRDGLRVVKFQNDRLKVEEYYMSFIKDEDHLKQKFCMFKPLHIGYYAAKFRNDEGDAFHYTFCGLKSA